MDLESRAKNQDPRFKIKFILSRQDILVEPETFARLALSFPDTEEMPHFEMASFRWRKKIFATLRLADGRAMVKLSLIDQDVFCAFDHNIFYPVPGSWGKNGSTFVNLELVTEEMLADALGCAYRDLVKKYKMKNKRSS